MFSFSFRENGVMVTLYPTMKPALLHNKQLDKQTVRLFLLLTRNLKWIILMYSKLNYNEQGIQIKG